MTTFFRSVLDHARCQTLLSEEFFSVDGTLLEAFALRKSFQPKDHEDRQSDGFDFRGQEGSNETRTSVTDTDARIYKKAPGESSHLVSLGHVLMNNRRGLITMEHLSTANGIAEVNAATHLVDVLGVIQRINHGADKGYDRDGFVQDIQDRNMTTHAVRKRKGSAIDGCTSRHAGYAMSFHVRRRIESIFGWMKPVGGMRKTLFRGLERVGLHFSLVAIAYKLIRVSIWCGLMGALRPESVEWPPKARKMEKKTHSETVLTHFF